ncbi:EP300-interacting inhibitor of differentiation 3 [Chionoecetes opilio]|uniref:Non-structural maintenance of chromosomes element 4 n=1 Tax=Chionoecetes opilio TaxID=41210 RepID=A0A8J4XRU9_CHIOP|nr:EP300-interacting inhibitor of differentiation 3 [Chionoecetes opilio]
MASKKGAVRKRHSREEEGRPSQEEEEDEGRREGSGSDEDEMCPRFHSHRVVLRSQLLALNVATCDLPTLLVAAGVHPYQQHAQSFLSEEANKGVRDKYWELMTVVHQHKDEDKNMDTHSLQLLVLEANEAFVNVKRPREAAIDAQLLKTCGNMAKLNIETSQSGLAVFKPRDFAEKLISFAATEEEDDDETDPDGEFNLISKIGRKALHLYRSTPGIEPFFSAVDWERPQIKRKIRQKKKDSEEPARREATQVTALVDHQGEEEAEAVSWICKALKDCYAEADNTPLPFFNFVVDPASFTRTAENLFHVSLLVREQFADIIEEDGLPVIRPSQTTGVGVLGEDKQCILSMDLDEWQELIKVFKITRAMIPPMRTTSRKRR